MANSSGLSDVISISSNGSLFQGYSSFFSFPIDSVSIFNKSNGGGGLSYLIRQYDTTINSTAIRDVAVINRESINFFEQIHIAPYYGIIKFQNSNDSTEWVLKRFNIQ